MASAFWQDWQNAVDENPYRTLTIWDVWITIMFGIMFTLVRLAYNKSAPGLIRQFSVAQSLSTESFNRVMEEVWLCLTAVVFLVLPWAALVLDGKGCSPLTPAPCVRHWPHLDPSQFLKITYNSIIGWYVHCLAKQPLGLGYSPTSDLQIHHVVTIVLLGASVHYNVVSGGMLVLLITAMSSPLLHGSKCLHYIQLADPAKVAFGLFAAVFAVARLVLYPYACWELLFAQAAPAVRGDLKATIILYSFAVGLGALAFLQVFWFYKIVKILVGGVPKNTQAQAGSEKVQQAGTQPAQQPAELEQENASQLEQQGADDTAHVDSSTIKVDTIRRAGSQSSGWIEVGDSSPASEAAKADESKKDL